MQHLTSQRASELILERRAARRSLGAFCKFVRPNHIEAAHHRKLCLALEALEQRSITRLIIEMPPRHGKALALDTPVPTTNGWSTMGQLSVGDTVFDENGKPCHVTWVSPVWRDRDVYTVETDDGECIVADAEHEWPVVLCRKRPVEKIKTTKNLSKPRSKRPMIRTCGPLCLPDAALPVDPYILGYWLGDGTSSNAGITCGDADMAHLLKEIKRAGYESALGTKNKRRVCVRGIRRYLVSCDVLNNKHIPPLYLRASIEQRKELLRGLIDSDGYVDPTGQIEFCSMNKRLALDTMELVHSLGHKASVRIGRATIGAKDCGEKYRLSFYMNGAAKMPRKASLCRHGKRATRRYLTVKPAGKADTICIEVDSPSHLFLAGRHMVPTHNSYHVSEAFPAWFMGRNPGQNVIATSHGDSQARRFGRRVRSMIELRRYQSLFPGTRLDQRANASDEFLTQSGGMYLAVGINGSFMGQGANLLIVDDPFRSRSDAESPTIRANVQSAYDDLETRLEPGGVIVVMHTRWHDLDLVGFIEQTRIKTGKEHWERLTMPMIRNECMNWERYEADPEGASENDRASYEKELALWPERFDLDACRHRRRTIPRKTWVSLYQQKPSDEGGDFFKADWLQMFRPGEQPTNVNTYITCDYGVREGGDTTELYRVDIDDRGHWWVTDCWSGSENSAIWCGALVDMIQAHNPDAVTGEAGVIRRAVEPFIGMLMDESQLATTFLWAVRNANKQACAVGLQGIASMRRLHIADTDWGRKLAATMRAFPTSADDHGVDALANLSLCMDQTPGAFALQAEPSHSTEGRWERIMREARGGYGSDWKTA